MNYRASYFLNNILFRRKIVLGDLNCLKCVQKNICRHLFHESHPKGEYRKKDDENIFSHIKNGWRELKNEFKLWTSEVKEKVECDPILNYYPGVVDKQWDFRKQAVVEQWITTSDSDHNEGYSSCEFIQSKSGCALFTGTLDTRVPKDGRIKRAGYCSVRSQRAVKSFKRDSYLNWAPYTHLVIRLRGDGRTYMINIATSGYYDQLWNDVFHYMLFTRGGPYWQVAKIPFSKFFLSSKGRIQDKQACIDLEAVTNLGFTCGDKINGPFSLEIDYVGLEFNLIHDEEFAYEMYQIPKFLAAT